MLTNRDRKQQLEEIPSYPEIDESQQDRVTKLMKDRVRNTLSVGCSFVSVLTVTGFLLFPFTFPNIKKIEHRFINITMFTMTILAGYGLRKMGELISHDEPLILMERQLQQTLTLFEFGVTEQEGKNKIMNRVLPPLPSLEPANAPAAQQQLDVESKEVQDDSNGVEPQYKYNSQSIEQHEQNAVTVSDGVVSYQHPTKPQEQTGVDEIVNGQPIDKIIYDLALSTMSVLLSAVPGTGKTTLTLAWLWCLLNVYPNAEIHIIGQKRDNWLGLGAVPGVLTLVGNDVSEAVTKVIEICDILRERSGKSEEERKIYKDKPVRLIFDDYTSIYLALAAIGGKQLKIFTSSIAYLITVGRECNVCVYIAAHSFNLKALGLEGKDIRDVLNLICLGFDSVTEDGKSSGGFDSIDTILNNPNIVKPGQGLRERLIAEYPKLKAQSRKESRQLLFSTLGGCSLRLLNKLLWVKGKQVVTTQQINLKKNDIATHPKAPVGQIDKIETWLTIDFPNGLNKLPAYRPGLYAFLIENKIVYIGQSHNLFERLNIKKHQKKPYLYQAHKKGLNTKIAYFSTNISDEERAKWEETLINKYDCEWNGRGEASIKIPDSVTETLSRQDKLIHDYCVKSYQLTNQPIKVRDIQRFNELRKEFDLDSAKIKNSLTRLEASRKGVIKVENFGSNESWQYTPNL